MSDLINPGLVLLDRDLGESTESVIRALAATVHREGRASTADSLAADALAREAKNATGIPGGIGIPHCRSEAVTQATLVMARRTGLDAFQWIAVALLGVVSLVVIVLIRKTLSAVGRKAICVPE